MNIKPKYLNAFNLNPYFCSHVAMLYQADKDYTALFVQPLDDKCDLDIVRKEINEAYFGSDESCTVKLYNHQSGTSLIWRNFVTIPFEDFSALDHNDLFCNNVATLYETAGTVVQNYLSKDDHRRNYNIVFKSDDIDVSKEEVFKALCSVGKAGYLFDEAPSLLHTHIAPFDDADIFMPATYCWRRVWTNKN